MNESARCEQLRELIETHLPPDELDRLTYADTLLRIAAAGDRNKANSLPPHARVRDGARALHTARSEALNRPRAAPSSTGISVPSHEQTSETGARPSLRLLTIPPGATGSTRDRSDQQTHELKLTFSELALIYTSLQAAKTLGALPPQDELLNDTIHLVDLALKKAV
jgi:hypothetical protein